MTEDEQERLMPPADFLDADTANRCVTKISLHLRCMFGRHGD